MLETPGERVALLKSGISGRELEELYIKHNNFRLIKFKEIPELTGEEKWGIPPVSPEAPNYDASVGDIVKFMVGSDIVKGEVRFIEKTRNGDMLYVDSFRDWAYNVTQDRLISKVAKNKIYSTRVVGPYRGEMNVSPPAIHALGGN